MSEQDHQEVSQRQVQTARERAEKRDDSAVMNDVTDELAWCEKEACYIVGGSEHPHAEERLGRIRQRIAEIDAMLAVIEDRARGDASD